MGEGDSGLNFSLLAEAQHISWADGGREVGLAAAGWRVPTESQDSPPGACDGLHSPCEYLYVQESMTLNSK